VVVGWSDPEGSRHRIGAFLLGYYTSDGKLVYAGRAGAGMPVAELERLHQRLELLAIPKMPLAEPRRAPAVSDPLWCCRECIGCGRKWWLKSSTRNGPAIVCCATSSISASENTNRQGRSCEIGRSQIREE
jgi:ATP-dependent DNA ligase